MFLTIYITIIATNWFLMFLAWKDEKITSALGLDRFDFVAFILIALIPIANGFLLGILLGRITLSKSQLKWPEHLK